MPGYDGTGPRGEGPMTGRGEGYCVVKLPETADPEGPLQDVRGYAGQQGVPIVQDRLQHQPPPRSSAPLWRAAAFGFGRRRWARRGRGRHGFRC